jgi:glycerol dehydrogenase-like iron-containing ADH family enzyme
MKIIENINKMRKEKEPFSPQNPYYKQYVSDLVDALISFGIYMCTVGSSVVASGTEHLWGHGLDVVASKYIPHGWGAGSGSGIAYYLFKRFRPEYCKPLNKILNNLKALLRYMGIPSTAKELGITKEEAIYSFLKAVEIGDERGRVTILDDIRLPYHEPSIKIDESFAREVLEATKII